MNPDELEILDELADCQGEIFDCNYTDEQRVILRYLEKRKYVALSWVLTPLGKKELSNAKAKT